MKILQWCGSQEPLEVGHWKNGHYHRYLLKYVVEFTRMSMVEVQLTTTKHNFNGTMSIHRIPLVSFFWEW